MYIHYGRRSAEKGYRGAHKHAVQRLAERFDLKLTDSQWAAIVDNAREGLYTQRTPRKTSRSRAKKRGRLCPVFRVPLRSADEGWLLLVDMVINLTQGLVVSVLPTYECVSLDADATPD